MKESNWLYCFSEKKQEIDNENHIGLFLFRNTYFNQSLNFVVDLEREDVDQFTFDENLQYAMGMLGLNYKYLDQYCNVVEKDLTYAALKYDYKFIMLVDSKKTKSKIKKIASELFHQWYVLRYPARGEDIVAIEKSYEKRNEILLSEILKFNLLK
jgi:hypothetical protein